MLSKQEKDFIKNVSIDSQKHYNKYAKLSISLSQEEKDKISAYKEEYYPRMSISAMILEILEKDGVFE